ncbi:hypothetical protein GCK32_000146 [Trichostrongylus colubriformis]|uniref:Uncharacterized protein n=1 Tax=Trichostrongylus colubriformis TaxID=6319 RepID=A0AAN8FQ31_TRICO
MLSTRTILALFYVLLFGTVIVTAAPNRIFMRFGKRNADLPGYRASLPAYYLAEELLSTSRFADGDM